MSLDNYRFITCNVNEFVYKHPVKYKETIDIPYKVLGEFTIDELPAALVSLCYKNQVFHVHLVGKMGEKVKKEMKTIEGSKFGRNQIEVLIHE